MVWRSSTTNLNSIRFVLVQFWFIFHGEHPNWCHLLRLQLHLRFIAFSRDAKRFNCRGKFLCVFVPRLKFTAIKLSNLLLRFHCCINTRSGLDSSFLPLRTMISITQTSLRLRFAIFLYLLADQFENLQDFVIRNEKFREKLESFLHISWFCLWLRIDLNELAIYMRILSKSWKLFRLVPNFWIMPTCYKFYHSNK